MRRLPLAIAAATTLAAVALPAAASATEVQIGQTATALVAPTCPAGTSAADCTILLTEMTGIETTSDAAASPTMVKQAGVLSSFTLGISSAAAKFATGTDGLNAHYGGPPEAQVTVLRKVSIGSDVRWMVAAEGPIVNLTSYQGDVVEFPIGQELPVVKGEVVALTSPTWAPVLSIDLSSAFSYTQSRTGNCKGVSTAPPYYNPQTAIGEQAAYGCSYSTTRVEYTATEILTPSIAAADRLAKHADTRSRTPHIISR